jgi:hypothetical protein
VNTGPIMLPSKLRMIKCPTAPLNLLTRFDESWCCLVTLKAAEYEHTILIRVQPFILTLQEA